LFVTYNLYNLHRYNTCQRIGHTIMLNNARCKELNVLSALDQHP